MSAAASKRVRVLGALRGEAVDQVPVCLWLHNYATENSAEGLAQETIRLAEQFDFDYLKPQSRAQSFAEIWGLTYEPSTERATHYRVTHHPVADAQGFARLAVVDPERGALGEQLAALRQIRAAVGPEIPIVWTVFAPMMVARYLVAGDEGQVLQLAREEPAALEQGLAAISATLADYTRACLANGADGIFYATTAARQGQLTAAECRQFQRPFDLPILEAASAGPFNMLHLCGDSVLFDEFADYPVTAFSWDAGGSNLSLRDGHQRTGKAVIGGLPAKEAFAHLTPEQAATLARAAVTEMAGRWFLLGPACSIAPDSPAEVMTAAVQAVRSEA